MGLLTLAHAILDDLTAARHARTADRTHSRFNLLLLARDTYGAGRETLHRHRQALALSVELDTGLTPEPHLRTTVGAVYAEVGQYEIAEAMHCRALGMRRKRQ